MNISTLLPFIIGVTLLIISILTIFIEIICNRLKIKVSPLVEELAVWLWIIGGTICTVGALIVFITIVYESGLQISP